MNEKKISQETRLEKIADEFAKANIHYGHKSKEWNPKMAPYIKDEKSGYHIIDLVATSKLLKIASSFVKEKAQKSSKFLFVGTTKVSSPIVAEFATKLDAYYVNYRWLGGMLTNWPTLQKRIQRLKDLENLELNKEKLQISKKDYSKQKKEREKLIKLFGGIQNMNKLPDVVIFTNQLKDGLAVEECSKLGIPSVCLIDTNCNPDLVPFPVPGNDDSPSSVRFFLSNITDAIKDGYNISNF